MSGFVRLSAIRDYRRCIGRAHGMSARGNRSLGLLMVLFLAAASPASRSLPVPPIPPALPNEAPAPVPDRDLGPPPQVQITGPKIVPRFLHVPTYQEQFDTSAGYVTGSHAEEDQTDRRLAPSPGFRLEIPLR